MQRVYLIIAGVLVLAAVVLLAWTLTADAGDAVPRTIRVTATLENVVCKLPICCGYASATYHGRYYDTGVSGYCKWLRPGRSWPTLRSGQRELMTLTLTRRVGR